MPIEKRDLMMEAHLQAIAIWYWIAAAVGVAAAGVMVVFLKDTLPAEVQRGMKAGMVIGVILAALSYGLGSYLMKYAEGARITGGVIAAPLWAQRRSPSASFSAKRLGRIRSCKRSARRATLSS